MYWSTGYNLSVWGGIATYGNYLYVSTGNTITQTNLTTGEIISDSWASGLGAAGGYSLVDNGYIYITNISGVVGTVYKITIGDSSGTVSTFFNTNLTSPAGVAVYNGYLYVASSGSNYISKISLTNPLGDYEIEWVVNSLIGNPVGLVINGDYMYVTCTASNGDYSNAIYKINMTNKQLTSIYGNDTDPYYYITIYENNIYTTNYNYNSVVKMDLNGNILDSSYASVPSPDGLLFNGNYFYAVSFSDPGAVYRYSTSSTPTTCFKEDTKILTDKGYVPIQNIRPGTLVKTSLNGYVAVDMIGKSTIHSYANGDRIKNRLYKCTKENYPEIVDEDLIVTGCHSILVDYLNDEQRKKTIEEIQQIYVTDRKYRLFTFLDPRAEPYQVAGELPIYHFALENENYYMNYGVYANGLLVESCSRRYLKELSGMTLIE
jgi:DNA-binding beta-propeller fold protein YncE